MNPYTQTVRTQAAVAAADAPRDAILVHIYPTGPEMGSRYPVGERALVVGRGDNCDIRINDSSVSRRHAMVQAADAGWSVTDIGSTNGTFLNNAAVASAVLKDGDYLRIGNCIECCKLKGLTLSSSFRIWLVFQQFYNSCSTLLPLSLQHS